MEDAWEFANKFDFIYGRALVTALKDPKALIQQAYDNLTPGGYLGLRDPIFPFQFLDPPPADSPLAEWNKLIIEAAAKYGRPWMNAQHYQAWMKEVGFQDVTERREFTTLSPWAKGRRNKYLSIWLRHNLLLGLEAWSLALFTRVLGWSVERLQVLLEGVRRDLHDTSIHAFLEG